MTLTLTRSFEPADETDDASDAGLALDELAFERLVAAEHARILRLFVGWVGNREEAESLTQECFLRAFRSRGEFRGDSRPATWLSRIAIHLALDARRSRRRFFWRALRPLPEGADERRAPVDPAPGAERAAVARERVEWLRSRVDELPERQQLVFRLRYFEELSLREIAELLELRVGTVKAHLHRATGAVRRAMEEIS